MVAAKKSRNPSASRARERSLAIKERVTSSHILEESKMFDVRRLVIVGLCLVCTRPAMTGGADQGVENVSIEGDWKPISIVLWGKKWPSAKTELITIRIRRDTFDFVGMPDESGKFFALGMGYTVRQEAS